MSNAASLDINPKSNPVQTVAPPKEDNNMTRATDKISALSEPDVLY
jgi:site-specific DNA recombinase